jgi:hypothetical protein
MYDLETKRHLQDKKKNELFEVQGHVDCFLRYPGYCNGRVGFQWPDGKSTVLPWSLDKISRMRDKEKTRIMEKRLDFAPRQRANPQRFVKQFLANHKIIVLEHPPYSPDLAPGSFSLFPKMKSVLKGNNFFPFFGRRYESKNGGDPQQLFRKQSAVFL